MKKFLCLIVSCVLLFLSSCNKKDEYSFLYDDDEISRIEIIQIRNDIHGEFFAKTLVHVDDTVAFMEGFRKITYNSPGLRPPAQFTDAPVLAVRFSYKDGSWETLSNNVKMFYMASDEIDHKYQLTGYFDSEQYNRFLDSYLSTVEEPNFPLACAEDMITNIEIVDVSYENKQFKVENVYVEVENISDFLSELKKVKYTYDPVTTGDENPVKEGTVRVVKVNYSNGDCELFTDNARYVYNVESTNHYLGVCYIGRFDKTEFESLIVKYITL